MRTLRERMDAGVSASSAVNSDARPADFLKRVFERVLNCVAMRLTLPACERRTVISNGQLKPLRHFDQCGISFAETAPRSRSR